MTPLFQLNTSPTLLLMSSDWDLSGLNAAYLMRKEDKVGSIEVGKEADFIILNRNTFDIDPAQIGKTKVNETYFRGELVYER